MRMLTSPLSLPLFTSVTIFSYSQFLRIKFTDHGDVFIHCYLGSDKFKEMTARWAKEYENTLTPTVKSPIHPTPQSHEGGQQLLISVADTGAGMNAEQLLHLFNAFYQADSTTTKRHEGTGLGLAISKSLVRGHSPSPSSSFLTPCVKHLISSNSFCR